MANPIIFRKNTDIGAADAESDDDFLANCFVDTGDVQTLLDCSKPQCIVLGRTGSGKTALLKTILKSTEHAIELSPESLALNFVSNSSTLRFFEEAGVNLDMFYTLLWRHIITVELLKVRYDIGSDRQQRDLFERLRSVFQRDSAKERAINYLRDWGDKFWEETEYRTKEFTRKLETDLAGCAKIDASYLNLGVEGARRLSEEQRIEVRERGIAVVNEVQVKALRDLIDLLAKDVFDDPLKRYYIVIDRLDDDWVSDTIRFKLIKALIEATRTFRRIHNVKIIVAIRTDLHYRVLRETASAGFQEEKYRSSYLHVTWSRPNLVRLLDKRVSYMFKRQYTRQNVSLTDIMPTNQIDQRTAIDHILDRTFFRPREAILFLNECIQRAEGQSRITLPLLQQAEMAYSQQRQSSLADEWRREYPNLRRLFQVFIRRNVPFKVSDISKEDIDKLCVSLLDSHTPLQQDEIYQLCEKYYLAGTVSLSELRERILQIMYTVGAVGVKLEPHLSRQWSYLDDAYVDAGILHEDVQIDVHKTFWLSLGITKHRGNLKRAST